MRRKSENLSRDDDARIYHLNKKTGLNKAIIAERFGLNLDTVKKAVKRHEERAKETDANQAKSS